MAALAGSALLVVPGFTASGPFAPAGTTVAQPPARPVQVQPDAAELPQIAVDGSLPQPTIPPPLAAPGAPNIPRGSGSATPSGPLGIPGTALQAYKHAAEVLATQDPGCHLDWELIASIGRIESNHARGGYVKPNGDSVEPILGPVLDGTGGFAAIADSDHGRWDGNTTWDRAVGPMQFLPSTWLGYEADGNGDGVTNPNNLFDATLGAGEYLCAAGTDLSQPGQQATAVYRYNHSTTYVDTVLTWAQAYRGGAATLPDSPVPIGAPDPRAATTPPDPGTQLPAAPPPPGTTPPGTSVPPTSGSTPPPTSGSTPPPTSTTTPTTPPTTPPSTTSPTTPPPTSTTPPTTPPPSTTSTTPPPPTTPTTTDTPPPASDSSAPATSASSATAG
jgi:membrane-bound lytic murein transglycosylase B